MATNRKEFIEASLKLAMVGSIAGMGTLVSCGKKEDSDEEGQEVSPPEDLMQEHGLLNRILLIYDNCRTNLTNKQSFNLQSLASAAGIIRTFVEDYHEKQEEQYLFPRFRKANQLTDLVDILLQQHQVGRRITDQVMQLTKSQNPTEVETQQLIALLEKFNRMYRLHEAREDTVLSPPCRKIVSKL